jgi:DNA-binding winged helix-turn-helix (wHTH) protein/Tol biopolymer transport system component
MRKHLLNLTVLLNGWHWSRGPSLSETKANSIVRFGVFEVDLRARELRRNGSKVRLQEQPFQVLTFLLERPGQLVTRDELHARLWPADTFVDFDHGLNAAIKRLRDALGDYAENPRFVETLARRGYRFVAPINRAPQEIISAPQSRRRWRSPLAVAAILLLGISAGWHAGHRSAASIRFTERRLTGNPENDPVLSAAISPDSKYLAFADRAGLFLRVVGTGETHPVALPDTLKPNYVNWFPDGSHVLVTSTARPSEKPGLWNASVFGGSPVKLASNGEHGAVSPDGSKIVFLRGEYGREEIWQMQSDGQQARKILGQPGDNFQSVVWSPDSRHIAFVRTVYIHGWEEPEASLGICDPVASKTNYILSSSRLRGPVVWALDWRLIYSLGEPPPSQNDSNLWAIKIDARGNQTWGQPERLTSGPDAKVGAGISADSRHLLFLRWAGAPEVYVAEVKTGGDLGTPHRLSLDERRNIPYAWTLDSKSVIFTSDRDGAFHIFKQSIDQPAPDLLVGGDKNVQGARLNPDGSEILYFLNPSPTDADRRTQLMRVPLSGGTSQLVLAELGLSNVQCARAPSTVCILSKFSRNGLVFMTFDPVSGKEKEFTRIEDPEWYLHNWTLSPDGSTLALSKKHRTEEQAMIRLLPVAGGTERTISFQPWSGVAYIDWAADGRSLWVRASSPAGTQTLLNVDLHGKAKLALQESEMDLGWAIPSPDGRHVAIWEASGSSNAWLLENF